jgi:predicted small lipoprotein YifL
MEDRKKKTMSLFLALALICAATLTACGKRAPLDAPPTAQKAYPRSYPAQ